MSIGIGLVVILLLFPKLVKGVFGTTRRRKRRSTHSANVHRAIIHHSKPAQKRTSRRYVIGRLRRPGTRKHRSGEKKPWQIKGSLAARRHMALIRKRK